MNRLKSLYVSSYVSLVFLCVGYATYSLITSDNFYQSLGALIANLPTASLMSYFFLFKKAARTSANLYLPIIIAIIGATITLYGSTIESPDLYLLLASIGTGFAGLLVYVFWYSRFGGRENNLLEVGNKLPEFNLEDENHNKIASKEFLGSPSLIMFYRGNWCPLCMAQIKEIAEQYKTLAEKGVKVLLVSPQPHKHTASLAKKFDVPFKFLVDKDNTAAKTLNIESIGGTPLGMEVFGYDGDTVMPTVLITDANGKIIFADLTDNYRVRPEPETFINVLNQHGIV